MARSARPSTTRPTGSGAGCAALLLLGLSAFGCGGSGYDGGSSTASSPAPTAPTPSTPALPGPIVRITASGVTPKTIGIQQGQRVTFANDATQAHDVSSDPHPDHTGCPEINSVGFLSPGQSRQTANFVTAKTCGYHDHDRPTDTSLQGVITVR